jgi:hypothetical protein
MAKQVIALEATLNSGPAEGSVKSLKAQLREAQQEVVKMSDKFGETSTQAANAARKAAELKDRIGDAKALTDAFSPDKKFNAFAGALQGVAGGFAAVQGAMGLIGAESEDVEKTLLKVNSAMALAQGLNAVTESIDTFKNLGTVLRGIPIIQKAITMAQWLWNAAMAANPIGAIVAAVAALIAGIVALTKYLIDNSNANKTMAKEIEKSTKALKEQSKAYEKNSDELQRQQGYTLELAKAKGATTEEIRKLEKKLMDERVAHLENARQIAVNTFETEKNTLAKYKASGATDEVITKQRELTKAALEEANKVTGDLNKALVDRVELQRKHNVQVVQENTNAGNKAKEQRKQQNDQAAEDLRKANEDARNQRQKLAEENALLSIKDERKRQEAALQIQFENQQLEIERSKANRKEKDALLLELENNFLLQTSALRQKFADEDAQKKKEQDEKEIQAEKDLDAVMLKLEEESADERIKIAEAEANAKQELNNAYFDSIGAGIGILKMFSEKNKGLQKASLIAENALTIARIILDTQKANAAVTAKYALIPGGQPIAAAEILTNKIKAGIGIATAIAATAKGLQGIGAGGSTGGGGGNLGGGGGGTTTAPIQPQLGATALNQQLINQSGNAAVRAFVLETDVSGNQERIKRLNRAARIN